jgi:hypothetical protein
MISMTASATNLELRDVPLPDPLIPTHGFWPWWMAAGLLVLLVLMVWRLLHPRRPAVVDLAQIRSQAHAEALAALDAAELAVGSREAAVEASLILRKYLSRAAADPALFETHEEFISRHDALSAINAPARSAASRGFSQLALLKYGPVEPSAKPAEILADARALLQTLHQGFAA